MGATVLPDLSDIDPGKFLPSSRSVAFRKSAWQAVDGYPEWLDYGEDLIFDLNLRKEFEPFPFVPEAVAYYRPRGDLRAFARQYYHYARGDGEANLWPKRHAIRYLTYLVGLPILGALIWQRKWTGWALLLAGVAAYVRRPAQRLWPATRDRRLADRASAYALIPIIRLVGDVAKMIGYPAGWLRRWRQGPWPKDRLRQVSDSQIKRHGRTESTGNTHPSGVAGEAKTVIRANKNEVSDFDRSNP